MPRDREPGIARVEAQIDADLTASSAMVGAVALFALGPLQPERLRGLLVHPYAKHWAQHVLWTTGWRIPVIVDWDLGEDEWLLRATTVEYHSAGA